MKPDIRVWNGDLFDFYQISRFSTDSRRKGMMADERDLSIQYIKQMRGVRRAKTRDIALPGNHEWRINEFQRKHATIFDEIGLIVPTWWSFLHLDKMGFEIHDFEDTRYPILSLGHLKIFHGDRTNKHAVVNVANDWGCSVLYGHTHRMRSFFKTTLDTTHGVWENGYLADSRLERSYIKGVADWQQGFSWVDFDEKSGWYQVTQVPVCRIPHKKRKAFMSHGRRWECEIVI